jgi:SAM-dependent methyltransferase
VASGPHLDPAGYDGWFDTPWGHHAFSVENAALSRALGSLARKRVLDVGCGTGRFTARLEEAAPWVSAMDIDLGMLRVAATRVRGPLLLADAHHLPYADAAFDTTVAITLCEFTADHATVIGEFARVTRPGGRVAIGALNPRSPWGLARRRRLRAPPWHEARFLARRELRALGEPHGRISLSGSLLAPGAVPPHNRLAAWLEEMGRRLVPGLGAFQVLTITKTTTRATSPIPNRPRTTHWHPI